MQLSINILSRPVLLVVALVWAVSVVEATSQSSSDEFQPPISPFIYGEDDLPIEQHHDEDPAEQSTEPGSISGESLSQPDEESGGYQDASPIERWRNITQHHYLRSSTTTSTRSPPPSPVRSAYLKNHLRVKSQTSQLRGVKTVHKPTSQLRTKKGVTKGVDKLYSAWKSTYGALNEAGPGQQLPHQGLLQSTNEESKKEIFAANLARISAHNRLYEKGKVAFSLAVNQFTAETVRQIKQRMGIKPIGMVDHPEADKRPERRTRLAAQLAPTSAGGQQMLQSRKSFSWTSVGKERQSFVTPVGSQSSCASCYAFAAIAALESHYSIHNDGELVSFSDQQAIDCTLGGRYGNRGCESGKLYTIFKYVGDVGSLCLEKHYPYRIAADRNRCAAKSCAERRFIDLEHPYYIKLAARDVNDIMRTIRDEGPCACEFTVMDSFAAYGGGVYTGDPGCVPGAKRDHVMLVVGYGRDEATGLDYWLVKNSWSDKWGEKGYIKIQRGVNLCNIELRCRIPRFASHYYDEE